MKLRTIHILEYNTVIINLLYKACESKDIDNNAMKSFIIDTNIDILIGKINGNTQGFGTENKR